MNMIGLRSVLCGITACVAVALVGCGSGNGDVTISSGAFGQSAALMGKSVSAVTAAAASITEFKFCVNTVRLENESGDAEKVNGNSDIVFHPGLIDISSGQQKNWGTVSVATGVKISRLKIKVHKDKSLCGVDYSIRVNGNETDQDVEFKWKFNPAVELSGGQTVELGMTDVVTALSAGDLASLKPIVEGVEGVAQQK